MRYKREIQNGFTLVELLVVIAIVAILAAVAVPSFNSFFDKYRLKRAAEDVYGLIAKAKAETVTRNTDLIVSIDSGDWCIGYASAGCDCTDALGAANNCAVSVAGTNVLQVVAGSDFQGVTMASESFGGATTFDSVRGTAGTGSVKLQSGGWTLDVRVSTKGRLRICAPVAGKTMGYKECT